MRANAGKRNGLAEQRAGLVVRAARFGLRAREQAAAGRRKRLVFRVGRMQRGGMGVSTAARGSLSAICASRQGDRTIAAHTQRRRPGGRMAGKGEQLEWGLSVLWMGPAADRGPRARHWTRVRRQAVAAIPKAARALASTSRVQKIMRPIASLAL